LAVNSFIGQPQKVFFATKMAFSACYVLMVSIPGALHKHVRILVADFLKEIPMPLFHPLVKVQGALERPTAMYVLF
jgi:hypothetical protein